MDETGVLNLPVSIDTHKSEDNIVQQESTDLSGSNSITPK